jgi:hypothetical protein
MYANRAKLVEDYNAVIAALVNTPDLDGRIAMLKAAHEQLAHDITHCVDENLRIAQDQDAYNARYSELVMENENQRDQIAILEKEKVKRLSMRDQIERFLDELSKNGPLLAFDEGVWYATVEKATVAVGGGIEFTFRGNAAPIV